MLKLVDRRVLDHSSLIVRKAAYAPSGRSIVGGGRMADSARGFFTTRDRATGTRGPVLDAAERGNLMAMAASPADATIATCYDPGHSVDLWDPSPPRHLGRIRFLPEAGRRSLDGHLMEQTYARGLAFSPDGRRLAIGCVDPTAEVIDLDSGAVVEFPHPDPDRVDFVAFAPEGGHLVAGSAEVVVIWDLESGRRADEIRTPRENWQHLALDDAGRLVSLSRDGPVRLWDIPGGAVETHPIRYKGGGVNSALSPDRRWLARGWVDVTASYSPAHRLLAIGQLDGRVVLWDSDARACIGSLKVGDDLFHSLAFAPDGPRLCATMSGTEPVVEVEWKR